MRKVAFPALRVLALMAVAVTAVSVACGGSGGIKDPEEIVVAEAIEFKIPGDMDELGVAGIDSVVGQWESEGLSLLLDYGASSDSLGYTNKDGYRVTYLTISDRKAVIERFMDPEVDTARPYVAAVYFEDAGEGKKLPIFGRAASEDDQDLLLDIYRTLKWLDSGDA